MDNEIHVLKEFIRKVYFKEDVDGEEKLQLLGEIYELESVKLDDDFYYHLHFIYETILQRQKANEEEFDAAMKIVNG